MKEIPTNCILSKRIPGCGATTLELETPRSSIIVVPNVPVIVSKCRKYENLLGVYAKVGIGQIIEYLHTNRLRKIMTTPESFDKVRSACERCGINLYTDFFLLMDECHQLIKDVDYRESIVMHMADFFLFGRKALVSATPIGFSDPRFEEHRFELIEVTADYDYRQAITVTRTYSMVKAVGEYLASHDGTICFFVNSVVEIYSIMKHFDLLEDSAVYCAPKSRGKLMAEYNFEGTYTEWSADTMRKYNFFTGRFFTAFDLDLDYRPHLLMLTDPYTAEYTLLDVDTDCIQICGRFRNGISSATHIYRVDPHIIVKSREQVEWEISAHEHAYNTINTLYNSADSKESRFAFGAALESLPFRKYQYPDFTKNWFAVDNKINDTLVQNHYQALITEWYEACHYFTPTFTTCAYNENDEKLRIIHSARTDREKRKKIVQLLAETEEPASEYALDFVSYARKADPFIVEAYEVLGKEAIEALNYNEKRINAAMILAQRKGNKVVRLVKNAFKVGHRYTNQTIVDELTAIFNMLAIHPEKPITPKMITDYYQAVACWIGKNRGYLLVSELV